MFRKCPTCFLPNAISCRNSYFHLMALFWFFVFFLPKHKAQLRVQFSLCFRTDWLLLGLPLATLLPFRSWYIWSLTWKSAYAPFVHEAPGLLSSQMFRLLKKGMLHSGKHGLCPNFPEVLLPSYSRWAHIFSWNSKISHCQYLISMQWQETSPHTEWKVLTLFTTRGIVQTGLGLILWLRSTTTAVSRGGLVIGVFWKSPERPSGLRSSALFNNYQLPTGGAYMTIVIP